MLQQNTIKSDGKFVGFHQDVAYWGINPPQAVTVWMAMDKITLENGPMMYIPKSHRNGIYKHQIDDKHNNILFDGQEIPHNSFDVDNAVPMILNPGEISIHCGQLIHGSSPNLSDNQRRCGFAITYIDLETKILESNNYETDIKEWRTPRLICGQPKTDQYYYPYPTFIDNPNMIEPASWKLREWFPQ